MIRYCNSLKLFKKREIRNATNNRKGKKSKLREYNDHKIIINALIKSPNLSAKVIVIPTSIGILKRLFSQRPLIASPDLAGAAIKANPGR